MNSVNRTKRMALTAVMLALGTVLSMIKIFQMPFGGAVTLLSMLPVAMLSIEYGAKWGFVSSFLYSVIQLLLGVQDGLFGWGLTPAILVGVIFLDYLCPFTAIGLAGLFRKKGYAGICLGVFVALFIRFAFHFLSGVVFWTNLDFAGGPVLYSLFYNGLYMLPECIITMIGACILFKIPVITKLMNGDNL